MASSATSATSFELIEDQTLTAEEVEMASQEAQEIRTREAAVAAGLVLDEPAAPPSASATDVMNDLSSALERLRVAFATPSSGLGAPGPAEEEDKDMEDADATERATPPTKRLKGFVAASQKTTAHVNKPVSLVPVEGRPGYFKLVDLPDLFPVLPASAATLLRDVTVEEAVSLFHKFVGKNLTEDLVIRILEAYVPMKIQIRQEEVWASQFQRNKACIGTQRMHQDLIRQLGCSPPLGASGPKRPRNRTGGHHAPHTGPAGRKYINKHFPKETKHVFWASVDLAQHQRLKWWARKSSRPPGATRAGFARASGGRAAGGPGCSRSRGGTKTRPHACSW